MEEYKYKLIGDGGTGDYLDKIKTFIDDLDSMGHKYLYSAELNGEYFTLYWNCWVPGDWRKKDKVNLGGNLDVFVENIQRETPRVSPSVERALAYLAYFDKMQQQPAGDPPTELTEKSEILDSCGLIEVEYQHRPLDVSHVNSREAIYRYYRFIIDWKILEAGHEYLRRFKIAYNV